MRNPVHPIVSSVTTRTYYGTHYICYITSYDYIREYHLKIEAINEDWHKYEIYPKFKMAYERAMHLVEV